MTVQGIKDPKLLALKLTKNVDKLVKGLRKGLLLGGLTLQRESQKVVPVDTGALRASANTRLEGTGTDSAVIVSYGTIYGLYVHEAVGHRRKPGKQAKFLTGPLHEHKERITNIVRKAIEEALK